MNYGNELAEKFRRERNKSLKKFFNNAGVKLNFIIEILTTIEKEHQMDCLKWFELPYNNNDKMVKMDFDSPDYEICRHIIGTYKSLILFKSINERKELEQDKNFKKRLIDEIVFRLNLHKYSRNVFRKSQLFYGDNFIFFSIPYYVFVICSYLLEKNDRNNNYTGLRLIILQKSFAILDLIENNIIDDAYTIGRGIIESYVKYLCLNGNKMALEKRNDLVDEEISHNVCGNEFSERFENMYNARKSNSNNKLYFLHYGFVDEIKNYYEIIGNGIEPYSVTAIFKYLKETIQWNKKSEIENLEKYYNVCHIYVHGNCFNKYPINGYLDLSEILYIIVVDIFKTTCKELKIDYLIDGQDVLAYAEKAYERLKEQIASKNTELLDEYYKL